MEKDQIDLAERANFILNEERLSKFIVTVENFINTAREEDDSKAHLSRLTRLTTIHTTLFCHE